MLKKTGSTMFSISEKKLAQLSRDHGTPCWVYDAEAIRRRVAQLKQFDVVRYAQKANSNTHVLRLLKQQNVLVDAVSLGEVERALVAGYDGAGDPSGIVYASDLLDESTLGRLIALNIPVNAGSPQMLEQVGQLSPGHRVWIRVNPGFGSGFSRKTNTGGENSKHGIWHEHLDACYDMVDRYDLDLVGLHMHIGSGANFDQLQRVSDAMVIQAKKCPYGIRAISAGGGLPVPYRDEDSEVDVAHYYNIWNRARTEIADHVGHAVSLEIEPGRFIVANAGYLISEVRAKKHVGSNHFILVDAGFNDLMRPAMYGSHHGISIIGSDGERKGDAGLPTMVAGPICEAGDVFTQDSGGLLSPHHLPDADVGDLAIFHDCGAYCSSMSSNYNSRPLLPEILVDGENSKLIRRRQAIAELISLEDN